MTHQDYFRKYRLSLAQYAEILVAQAFDGKKTADGYRGFDVENAKINGRRGRIEVKSKWTKTPGGKATVIHCKENKRAMTHLAVVLVEPDNHEVNEAWLITKTQAFGLRRRKTKSRYINVKELSEFRLKTDITRKLNTVAKSRI